MIQGRNMYENVIRFIRNKEGFSPTIFYDLLCGAFLTDFLADKKLQKILKKQGKADIYSIDYMQLDLGEVIAVLNAIYMQANNLVCPSKMFSSGKLDIIADRLEQLDVAPENGKFDERMYYYCRNLVLTAMGATAFTKHRLLFNQDNKLHFFNDCKELNEVKVMFATKDFAKTMYYLEAAKMRKWIRIFKPDHCDYYVLYPGERADWLSN